MFCVAWICTGHALRISHWFYTQGIYQKILCFKEHVHPHPLTWTFTQTVHLVPTDSVAHLGLVECEKPPFVLSFWRRLVWSGSWLRIPDAAPNPVSQPLLSSMVERGRTAEQISLCFSTLVKAASANTHQHSSTWRQLTPFSLLQAEQLDLRRICFVWAWVCMIG